MEDMTAAEVTACNRFPSMTETLQRLDDVLEYLRGKLIAQLTVKRSSDYARVHVRVRSDGGCFDARSHTTAFRWPESVSLARAERVPPRGRVRTRCAHGHATASVAGMLRPPLGPTLLRLALLGSTVFHALACGEAGDSSTGEEVGTQTDIVALSKSILPFCAIAQCTDYSQDECEYYLRLDTIEMARFSREPRRCMDALIAAAACWLDTRSCEHPSCEVADDSCLFAMEAPEVEIPDSLAAVALLCAHDVECYVADSEDPVSAADQAFERAECDSLLVTNAALYLHDVGQECLQRYIDDLECIERADLSCDADGDDEQQACPDEDAALTAACFTPRQ